MIIDTKSDLTKATMLRLLESIPSCRARHKLTSILCSLRKGLYMWDPWLLKDGDVYMLFYLAAPSPTSWSNFWTQGTICGAVSTDLQNWKFTGIILEPEPANIWESGRIMAGSTYKEDGTYYLFYSASGGEDLLVDERIGLATSTDGLNWKRHSHNPFFLEDDRGIWYGTQQDNGRFHWRDPYVIKDHSTSKYYMFISAYSNQGTLDRHQGCVGLAVSDNIAGPYKLLPPVAGPIVSEMKEWPFTEMERPQVIYRNGKYHLFCSCWGFNLNQKWIRGLPIQRRIIDSALYWFVSDSIVGPFKPVTDVPIVPGSEKTGIYGTNFFPMSEEDFIAIGWHYRLGSLQVSPLFKVNFSDELIEIRHNPLWRKTIGVGSRKDFDQSVASN